MVDAELYALVKSHRTVQHKVILNANYGLELTNQRFSINIKMFINCSRCTKLMQDFINRGNGGVRKQGVCGNPVLSAQFFYKSQTSLKN